MANIGSIKEKLRRWRGLILALLAISVAIFLLRVSFRPQYQPGIRPLAEKETSPQPQSYPEGMPQFPVLYQSRGSREATIIYDEPSSYGRIVVYDYKGNRTLIIDGIEQSTWDFEEEKAGESYVRNIDLFFQNYLTDVEDVLIVGAGGGTLLKEWEGEGFRVDAVEINPKVVEIMKEYFVLPEELDYEVITDDGRHFLGNTDKKYDVIVLDICEVLEYNAHLWTKEFFELAKSKLKKDSSFLVATLYMMGEGGPYRLGHMVANTLKESFKNIYASGDPSSHFSIINFFATNELIDVSSFEGPRKMEDWAFDPSYPLITDEDTAKIVQYHYPVLEHLREVTIRNLGIDFLVEE